jgi:plasmid stabilization system protein ParE
VEVLISSRADEDLVEILADSLERFGWGVAEENDTKLRNTIRRLGVFPGLGRIDLQRDDGTRIVSVGSFNIVYTIVGEIVHVSRITSVRRNV